MPDNTNGGDDFFAATDQLTLIYQWARARYAAPWAVFGAVLLRVAASVGPHVQLPGLIGGRASLNLLCAFVSASGGGKGISDKVARLAWPAPIIERPIGSGEGIAATFVPPKKEGVEPITAAIFSVPEIDTLAGIASRQGSILLAQLKSMAMGELLGQSNASDATTRIIPAHSYRCCLSVGAQPGHCDVIFNDSSGGTPQRFLWFPTTDPDMPAVRAPDPDPLNTALPMWAGDDGVVEIGYGPEEIGQTVIEAHLARQRGQAEALDGHALLTRCKVAAVLAVMHHRSVVSELDWQLSGTAMAVSDRTRDWIVEQARQAARAKVRDRALSRAVGEEFVDQRRLDVVKRRVVKVLSGGRIARGELRARMGKQEYRQLLEAAVAELESEGLVRRIEATQGGMHFESTPEFSPEPEFRTDNSRSDGLNREFSPEPVDNVTDLDTRRSTDSDSNKLSCQDWFDGHVAELRKAGNSTAESFAVFGAGIDAGYTRANLNKAVKAAGLTVIARTNTSATWSLTGDQPAYQTAGDWLADYLDRLGADTVDPDRVKAAGAAAGHDWETLRRAASRSPRIESTPAHGEARSERIWHILTPEEGEAS